MAGISANTGYLKSIPGILKLVEFFLLLIAFACVSDCCHARYSYSNEKVDFFIAVTVIAWLVVIGLFVVFFLNLNEKVKQLNWNLVVFIVSIVFALLLLISGALLADLAHDSRLLKGYKLWDTMVAGIAFGFLSMIAFIIDVVMHFGSIRGGGSGGGASTEAQAA